MYYKEYLKSLSDLLQRWDDRVVKTYIFYNVLFSHAWRFTPRVLRETMMGYLKDIRMVYSDAECAKVRG